MLHLVYQEKGTEMTDMEARETIRQMLKDWNNATEAQRQEALRIATQRANRGA
jgi:hypothetical protein